MGVDVEPPDAGLASRLVHKAREDIDERGLAGAVRSEKAEDLPARHVEAHPVQRPLAVAVGLLQTLDRNCRICHQVSIAFPRASATAARTTAGSPSTSTRETKIGRAHV